MDTPILIYLAGPITGVSREKARGWRKEFTKLLLARLAEDGWDGPTVLVYDPASAFSVSTKDEGAWDIAMQIDDEAVKAATIVVAQFIPDVKSQGTDREVSRAMTLEKHVIAFGPDTIHTVKRMSLLVAMLDVNPEPSMLTVCTDHEFAMWYASKTLKELATAEKQA